MYKNKRKVYIKENSNVAYIAAKILRCKNMAITIGNTIFLYNVSKSVFLNDQKWVLHELKHVQQYYEKGKVLFLFRYLLQSATRGYYNNKYECEARASEGDTDLLHEFYILH